jgi:DNA-binding NtrC family response regulator
MTEPLRPVLVIEDESSQRIMYERALRTFGLEPVCVASGDAALATLAESSFGVAILDLNLGAEDGLDVFERLREHHPDVSVVIATGHGSLSAIQRAIRLDVVDFLQKPIGLDDLEAAVDRAWSRHELVRSPVAEIEPPENAPSIESLIARADRLELDSIEHAAILEALRRSGDNRKVAAEMLGVSERMLYYRLSQYRKRIRR